MNINKNRRPLWTSVFYGAPEETRTPDLLIRSHKSKQITICNLLTLRVMENVE